MNVFQRTVSVVLLIAILLGSLPQQAVRAAPIQQTSAGCVVFLVTGPAAGVLVPTCVLTWEAVAWGVVITAIVAGVTYTEYRQMSPSSSQQVRIGGGVVMVVVPEAPVPQPAPPASTPVPVVPQQTPVPAPRPTASSALYTEVRPDWLVACKGGPNPNVYALSGWHYSDCAKAGMPWPGPSAATTPVPAPAPLPEATPGGFEKLVDREEQVRADITATAQAQDVEERRNRRCPPLPPVDPTYTKHIAQGHSPADHAAAIQALNAGSITYYMTVGGQAWGAYRSTSPIPGRSERGWQVWSWVGGRWTMYSTYPRTNVGEPFLNPSNLPPAAGCRPVTLR